MLVIRLQRTGRENTPTYRLVVAEKARPVKGKFLEVVGHFLPARNPAEFVHEDERIVHWIKKGAIPSDTVARLLKKEGLKDMDKFIERYKKQKSKKEPAVAEAMAGKQPEAPAAEAAPEAPAAEAPAETPAA